MLPTDLQQHPHDKGETKSRIDDLKLNLLKSGHKSIGDWLSKEILGTYNNATLKGKYNIGNFKLPDVQGHEDLITNKFKKSMLHNQESNVWLKGRQSKNTKNRYLFQPNEINQRLALINIFQNFDTNDSGGLELSEFVDMFIQNYISNVYGNHSQIDQSILLGHYKKINTLSSRAEKDFCSKKNNVSLSQSPIKKGNFSPNKAKKSPKFTKHGSLTVHISSPQKMLRKNEDEFQESETEFKEDHEENIAFLKASKSSDCMSGNQNLKNDNNKRKVTLNSKKTHIKSQKSSIIQNSPTNSHQNFKGLTIILEDEREPENTTPVKIKKDPYMNERQPFYDKKLHKKLSHDPKLTQELLNNVDLIDNLKDVPILSKGFMEVMKNSNINKGYLEILEEKNSGEAKYSETDLIGIRDHLMKSFKRYYASVDKDSNKLSLSMDEFVNLAISPESNELFTGLMREIDTELKSRGLILEGNDDAYIPFSFEKMVSFQSYRSQRQNLFIKFQSSKDWNVKMAEAMNLFTLKGDILMDERQIIRGRSLNDQDLEEIFDDANSKLASDGRVGVCSKGKTLFDLDDCSPGKISPPKSFYNDVIQLNLANMNKTGQKIDTKTDISGSANGKIQQEKVDIDNIVPSLDCTIKVTPEKERSQNLLNDLAKEDLPKKTDPNEFDFNDSQNNMGSSSKVQNIESQVSISSPNDGNDFNLDINLEYDKCYTVIDSDSTPKNDIVEVSPTNARAKEPLSKPKNLFLTTGARPKRIDIERKNKCEGICEKLKHDYLLDLRSKFGTENNIDNHYSRFRTKEQLMKDPTLGYREPVKPKLYSTKINKTAQESFDKNDLAEKVLGDVEESLKSGYSNVISEKENADILRKIKFQSFQKQFDQTANSVKDQISSDVKHMFKEFEYQNLNPCKIGNIYEKNQTFYKYSNKNNSGIKNKRDALNKIIHRNFYPTDQQILPNSQKKGYTHSDNLKIINSSKKLIQSYFSRSGLNQSCSNSKSLVGAEIDFEDETEDQVLGNRLPGSVKKSIKQDYESSQICSHESKNAIGKSKKKRLGSKTMLANDENEPFEYITGGQCYQRIMTKTTQKLFNPAYIHTLMHKSKIPAELKRAASQTNLSRHYANDYLNVNEIKEKIVNQTREDERQSTVEKVEIHVKKEDDRKISTMNGTSGTGFTGGEGGGMFFLTDAPVSPKKKRKGVPIDNQIADRQTNQAVGSENSILKNLNEDKVRNDVKFGEEGYEITELDLSMIKQKADIILKRSKLSMASQDIAKKKMMNPNSELYNPSLRSKIGFIDEQGPDYNHLEENLGKIKIANNWVLKTQVEQKADNYKEKNIENCCKESDDSTIREIKEEKMKDLFKMSINNPKLHNRTKSECLPPMAARNSQLRGDHQLIMHHQQDNFSKATSIHQDSLGKEVQKGTIAPQLYENLSSHDLAIIRRRGNDFCAMDPKTFLMKKMTNLSVSSHASEKNINKSQYNPKTSHFGSQQSPNDKTQGNLQQSELGSPYAPSGFNPVKFFKKNDASSFSDLKRRFSHNEHFPNDSMTNSHRDYDQIHAVGFGLNDSGYQETPKQNSHFLKKEYPKSLQNSNIRKKSEGNDYYDRKITDENFIFPDGQVLDKEKEILAQLNGPNSYLNKKQGMLNQRMFSIEEGSSELGTGVGNYTSQKISNFIFVNKKQLN